ncbi:MAG: ATP-binding protein [Burkholderiales bacterium]|nr:ATP-binding protein [Burkholderiales bacterium]
MKVCLLGAESTGKSTLAHALAGHFNAQGRTAVVVGEVLREWCAREGRTPRPEEQLPIAQEQEARVAAAALAADVVIADTSALMVAIYSAMLFADGTLYQFALAQQRLYDATLVTGLDIPWVADGLQRDGPHVREPVDALVRSALQRGDIPYRVVYGSGAERLENALVALGQLGRTPQPATWTWACDKCSDPECEHRLFRRLL